MSAIERSAARRADESRRSEMTRKTRPSTPDERDACIAAADTLIDPILKNVVDAWVPVRDAYLAQREDHAIAMGASATASDSANQAGLAFDAAFRSWARTVHDERGRPRTADLTAMLGGVQPGNLPRKPHREKVTRARRLLTELSARPDLRGDAAALDALVRSVARLESDVTANEAAYRARTAAVAELGEVSATFDTTWGHLVRTLRFVDPEGAQMVVPRFASTRRRAPAPSTADATTTTAAPAMPACEPVPAGPELTLVPEAPRADDLDEPGIGDSEAA
jgi:hypothetical protein